MGSNPIIVLGTGRSGTTVFHRMLGEHPALSWLSGLCDKYPSKPILNRTLMRGLGIPVFKSVLRRKFHPSEAYAFWEHHSKGFSAPLRDLLSTGSSHGRALGRYGERRRTGKVRRMVLDRHLPKGTKVPSTPCPQAAVQRRLQLGKATNGRPCRSSANGFPSTTCEEPVDVERAEGAGDGCLPRHKGLAGWTSL